MSEPHPDAFVTWDVPPLRPRCFRQHCTAAPVVDRIDVVYGNRRRRRGYCAIHLAEINRELRDGVVWWRGTPPEPRP